jgi:thymidylate synthase
MDFKDFNRVWLSTLAELETKPLISSPGCMIGQTGKPFREIIGHSFFIDMNYPILNIPKRKMSYVFMYAEALWILSGSNRLNEIAPYCPAWKKFSDDGVILNGAYGPPILAQLPYIEYCLKGDSNSRQAVMTTWRQNPTVSKDIPCTVSSQFLIRENRLHLVHTMRSSDAWLGLPYDIYVFSIIAMAVKCSLRFTYPDLQLGNLHFTAGSQHLYEQDMEKVDLCLAYEEHKGADKMFDSGEPQSVSELCQALKEMRDYEFNSRSTKNSATV